jgi:hypothetical protein
MDFILIEVLLWAALIFFFWALKDNLGRVEADIEDFGLLRMRTTSQKTGARGFDSADQLLEPIGHYRDTPIFQYAVIGDRCYRFDRVTPEGPRDAAEDERCIAPGLIYVAVAEDSAALPQ